YPNNGGDGSGSDPSRIRGMFNRGGARISIASVTDGLSNTLLLGETLPDKGPIDIINGIPLGGWACSLCGYAYVTTIIPINYPVVSFDVEPGQCVNPQTNVWNWGVASGFKSNHAGGANFAFADGSVHFIGQSIDTRTFQLLGCRNDGQTVQLP